MANVNWTAFAVAFFGSFASYLVGYHRGVEKGVNIATEWAKDILEHLKEQK